MASSLRLSILTMKAPRLLRLGVAVALLPALPVALSGCACTTVGYINTDPIAVKIVGALPDGAILSACLDDGCTPAEVAIDGDGRLEIPQAQPYRSADSINPPTIARVVVTVSDGTALVDERLEVRTAPDNPISSCPGPFHYEDLTLEMS